LVRYTAQSCVGRVAGSTSASTDAETEAVGVGATMATVPDVLPEASGVDAAGFEVDICLQVHATYEAIVRVRGANNATRRGELVVRGRKRTTGNTKNHGRCKDHNFVRRYNIYSLSSVSTGVINNRE